MIEKIYACSKEKKILKKYAFIPPLTATNPCKVVQPRKIRVQAKIHDLAFKNSNIVIEGIIQIRKDYFL